MFRRLACFASDDRWRSSSKLRLLKVATDQSLGVTWSSKSSSCWRAFRRRLRFEQKQDASVLPDHCPREIRSWFPRLSQEWQAHFAQVACKSNAAKDRFLQHPSPPLSNQEKPGNPASMDCDAFARHSTVAPAFAAVEVRPRLRSIALVSQVGTQDVLAAALLWLVPLAACHTGDKTIHRRSRVFHSSGNGVLLSLDRSFRRSSRSPLVFSGGKQCNRAQKLLPGLRWNVKGQEALAASRELETTENLNNLDLQTTRFEQARVNEGETAPIELNSCVVHREFKLATS